MDDLKIQISKNNVIGFEPRYLTRCWLCEKEFEVSGYETVKICNRCRKAWSKMRNIIENLPKYATGVHINHVGRETIAKTPNYTEDKI